jgi:hypothetical protein
MSNLSEPKDEGQVLDALATLIDNSLVWRVSKPAATRFTLPLTIRDYAAARLRADGGYDAPLSEVLDRIGNRAPRHSRADG